MQPGEDRQPPLSGIVACGGSGRRMGMDKALVQFQDQPLWATIARRLATICDPVFIARGTMPPLDQEDFKVITDPVPDSGPLSAIVAGLRASPHPHAAVVAVDLPNMSPTLIRFLAGQIGTHEACVPLSARGPEPLHAVYSTSALDVLEGALVNARLSLMDALADLDALYVSNREWPGEIDIGFAENLNRPQDVESLRGRTIPG